MDEPLSYRNFAKLVTSSEFLSLERKTHQQVLNVLKWPLSDEPCDALDLRNLLVEHWSDNIPSHLHEEFPFPLADHIIQEAWHRFELARTALEQQRPVPT
jgi:hypothetical protein